MFRVDDWLAGIVQQFYEVIWERMAVPIGTFRMALACAPICVDTCLELSQGRREPTFAGLLLYVVALCLLYSPWRMVRDDRLQKRGAFASLNAEARDWALQAVSLRRIYVVLTGLSLLLFHHLGGLALIGIAYARCIQIKPRAPTRRSPGRRRRVAVAS